MRYALIKNGIVQNIAVWDGVTPWDPNSGYLVTCVEDHVADIGWLYDSETDTFSAPPAQEMES